MGIILLQAFDLPIGILNLNLSRTVPAREKGPGSF
jgi:hypothetical protein